jgi:hypothetical protein
MTVQILKKVEALKTASSTKTKLQEQVDRLGEIDEILKEAKELIAEKESLRKALISETADFDDKDEAILEGAEYTVVFSPCAKTRKITKVEDYFEAVGEEVFLQTVNVPITEACKYLSPSQQKELITESTGARSLKAVIRRS